LNGTIRLLHTGGVTDDSPQNWRPVVLLNCTNQLVMHILNARLRSIVEKQASWTGPIRGEAGQKHGYKLDQVGMGHPGSINSRKSTYMASVWICSCHYTSIPQSRWRLMIRSVRRLHSIVAQGSALSPLIFLLFMNALLGLLTDRGQKPRISHGLKYGVRESVVYWYSI